MEKKSTFKKSLFKYLGLGIATIALGLGLVFISYSKKDRPQWFYVHTIGTSILTAGILIVTLEVYHKTREEKKEAERLKKIGENVFDALFEQSVPKVVIDQFVEHVVRSPFFKIGYNIRYNLNKISISDKKYLKGTVTVNYHLRNLSHTIKNPIISFTFRKDLLPNEGKDIQIQDALIERSDGSIEYLKADDKDNIFENDYVKVFKSDKLEIHGNETVYVSQVAELVFPLKYNEVMISLYASEELRFVIEYPQYDIDVFAYALHPSDEAFKHPREGRGYKEWHLNESLLPCQGINFWWYPRKEQEPTQNT